MADIFELFRRIGKPKTEQKPIEFIIACLGNPGREYALTRHNAGYLFAEFYSREKGFSIDRLRFEALTGEHTVDGHRALFLCPVTYMNLSGKSVRAALDFYKLPVDRLVVVCDDVQFDVGRMRIRKKGSDGGQRGLRNIIETLNDDAFPRIRIGVGQKPDAEYDMKDWVLSKFTEDEQKKLREVFPKVADALSLALEGNIDKAMNLYN